MKENNKLKERNEFLARESDFKNIYYIFLVDSFSKLNSSFIQLKNEYDCVVVLEKSNRLENEVLNRKNDELNAYHTKLINKWNKLVDDFNELNKDYTNFL